MSASPLTSNATARLMKAVVLSKNGGPEVLQVSQVPIPVPTSDQVLIKIKAFGLNRSDMYAREGIVPFKLPMMKPLELPRILGAECVGLIDQDSSDGKLKKGQVVAAAVGGLGRQFDGGYAQYTVVPQENIKVIDLMGKKEEDVNWELLAALPVITQTAWATLFSILKLQKGERLLISGGTTSVGLMAASLAQQHGAMVYSTSRNSESASLVKASGATEFVLDDGALAKRYRFTFDKVLDLIGGPALLDTLLCCKPGGIVCHAGLVADSFRYQDFSLSEHIIPGVCLTTYGVQVKDFLASPLEEVFGLIEGGEIRSPLGKVFKIDDIAEAHRCQEKNEAGGKIVVVTGA